MLRLRDGAEGRECGYFVSPGLSNQYRSHVGFPKPGRCWNLGNGRTAGVYVMFVSNEWAFTSPCISPSGWVEIYMALLIRIGEAANDTRVSRQQVSTACKVVQSERRSSQYG